MTQTFSKHFWMTQTFSKQFGMTRSFSGWTTCITAFWLITWQCHIILYLPQPYHNKGDSAIQTKVNTNNPIKVMINLTRIERNCGVSETNIQSHSTFFNETCDTLKKCNSDDEKWIYDMTKNATLIKWKCNSDTTKNETLQNNQIEQILFQIYFLSNN